MWIFLDEKTLFLYIQLAISNAYQDLIQVFKFKFWDLHQLFFIYFFLTKFTFISLYGKVVVEKKNLILITGCKTALLIHDNYELVVMVFRSYLLTHSILLSIPFQLWLHHHHHQQHHLHREQMSERPFHRRPAWSHDGWEMPH